MQRFILLAARNLLARELTVGDRVEAADSHSDFAVSDALNFKIVQAAKRRDLFKCERGTIDQPDGRRFGHQ